MLKAFRRLLTTLLIFILLLGGAVWWLLSYIAPDERLDMAYTPISVRDKALAIIKNLNTELVLTETDINYVIKARLMSEYASAGTNGAAVELNEDVRLDGAVFELEEDRLVARMNVTYKDRIPAQLDAVYALEWQPPNIALRPQSLAVKDIGLPLSLLEPILIPIELPEQNVVAIRDVQFEQNQIKVLFKVDVKLPF
ncbi:hypothetical protein L1N85_10435 [Paenibacillus alkaliterrae]|uniref:hypothetical protein n=1 Tax=Paenibacillus alkaliterrae TaxID=320909 RepID=UPI001F428CDA|nr:hypothetical protein [Paenibacillus alkaliterrae]MCF2938853.1 hypothetical protein [Paenibacillus alkaliterrae]